ncbi:MAG: hypothetical protein U0441_17215 [Polyangiaceae bacterium]
MAAPKPRDPALIGSPYRVPGPVAPPTGAELPAFRRRSWRLGLSFVAVVGSMLAHASLLAASALGAGDAAAAPAFERSGFGTGAFVVHAEFTTPQFGCAWPPPPALAECFGPSTLRMGPYTLEPFTAYGEGARSERTWESVPFPFPEHDERDMAEALFHDELNECARSAERDGWQGGGRVFVRVARGEDGAAMTQVLPLDEEANHAGLLCCLRRSQSHLAPEIRPGSTTRYVFTAPPGEAVTLTPEPI